MNFLGNLGKVLEMRSMRLADCKNTVVEVQTVAAVGPASTYSSVPSNLAHIFAPFSNGTRPT